MGPISDFGGTGRPSSATRSFGFTRCPSVARAPFTRTRPEAITASISRREPNPERASTLCSFSPGPAKLGRARLSGLGGFVRLRGGRRGLREVKRLDNVFQRRELLKRAQPE